MVHRVIEQQQRLTPGTRAHGLLAGCLLSSISSRRPAAPCLARHGLFVALLLLGELKRSQHHLLPV